MLGWAFTWLLGIELGSLGFHVASTSRLSCFPSTLCVRTPVDTCVDIHALGRYSVWDPEVDGYLLWQLFYLLRILLTLNPKLAGWAGLPMTLPKESPSLSPKHRDTIRLLPMPMFWCTLVMGTGVFMLVHTSSWSTKPPYQTTVLIFILFVIWNRVLL